MGLFGGHTHKWVNARGKDNQRCRTCGQLRKHKKSANKKNGSSCWLMGHRYKLDRRMKERTLRCKKCGGLKKVGA